MEFFEIAKILKPQGIRGELKLECYVRDMEHFRSVSVVYMKEGNGMRSFDVERIRISGDNAFITIEGCHDRNTAETLRNRTLYIDRKDAYPLEEDEDYIADLIGLEIIDDLGKRLGTLEDVIDTGGVLIYQVATENGKLLFPIAPGVELERNIGEGSIIVSSSRLKEVSIDV